MFDVITGQGLITLDYILAFFTVLATAMTIAVLRAPDIVETSMQQVARRIQVGGLMILSARYIYVLVKYGDIVLPPISEIGLLFILISICVSCLCRLFPHINEIDIHEAEHTLNLHGQEMARIREFLAKRAAAESRSTDRKNRANKGKIIEGVAPATQAPSPDPTNQPDPVEGPQK